jgi:hypothetical protein
MEIAVQRRSWFKGLIVAALVALAAAAAVAWAVRDPGIALLTGDGWIRYPEATRLPIHQPGTTTTAFRVRLDGVRTAGGEVLTLRAMRSAVVTLDGKPLFRTPGDRSRWKETFRIELPPLSGDGTRELRIDVTNVNGHPALAAQCRPLGLATGRSWEASRDGKLWLPALPADEIPPPALSRTFLRADRAMVSLLPLFVFVFLAVFLLSYHAGGPATARLNRLVPSAAGVRSLLIAAWLVMAANNFWKLPLAMGMDNTGHWLYIRHIAESWRIPLAGEGWQMFQPPLFHVLEALAYRLLMPFFEGETVVRLLKLLPLVCGMAQVEIVYRAMRTACPDREGLQVTGTLLGGLLPMNLYMAQSLGNEPLSGLLTALIVLASFRMIAAGSLPGWKGQIWIGCLLGLALLTKVTAILIVPPLLAAAGCIALTKAPSRREGLRSWMSFALLAAAVALALCGWYYLRNYLEMGRFFIGGWDPSRRIEWWQDPGFRTPAQLYRFGEALFYPVFSSCQGFWDAIYSTFWMDGFLGAYDRPPWNYPLMLSGAWLSLVPTAAILAGAAVALFQREGGAGRGLLRFSLGAVLIYLAAIFWIFLTVPILSSAKASYALGLVPCFALLAARGFEVLGRRRIARAALQGLFACWAAAAYGAYLAP